MKIWTTLIDAEVLAGQLGGANLRLFDCRFVLNDNAAGETAWREAHLPGAQYAHLGRDLSGPHRPGAGRHPWPDAAAFTVWLGRCGVTPDTQVVAYDAGDGAYAARLWWLLRSLGHEAVAVLDGGWARWLALGLPTTPEVPVVAAADYRGAFAPARLLDAVGIPVRLAAGDLLIDARAAERYRGDVEPIDRVAGHVPGAVNRPYAANLHAGRFKPAAQLAREFSALLGDRAPQQTIAMCGSGVTACHHLLAMAHAGLPGARLFTGSWSGWIEDPSRPVDRDGLPDHVVPRMPNETMPVEIWHNPACSSSRNALALIRHVGIEPRIVEYADGSLSKARIAEVIAAAGLRVRDAIREKDALFRELGLAGSEVSDDDLLDAMTTHPMLINRPFVIAPMGTRLCRPSERVLDILPPCERPFAKEDGEVVIDENGLRVR